MNLVLSQEKVWVNGKSIPKVFGGFAYGQPSILAKQIAEIHDCSLREINQLVNKNLDWFDDVLDFLDLKSVIIQNDHGVKDCLLKFYTQEGLNRSKNIYIFSQQGYAMLCKLLKSDLAKKIYKQMVREYFKMVEIQQNEESHREILTKRNDGEAEKYWLQGKLTEIIVEGLKQNREEMQQNRHEINQIHLELREVKEQLLAIERCISSKRNNSRKTTKK